MKLIKTMIIVLGGFLLTTGPLAILCVLSYFHNSRQLHSIMRVMVVISNLNSILNPFFYFLRIPYMSKNSKKLWRSFFSRLSRNGRHREIRRISRSMQTQENAVQMIEIAYPLEVPDIKNVSPDPHRNQENCEDDKLPARHSTSSMPWSSHDLLQISNASTSHFYAFRNNVSHSLIYRCQTYSITFLYFMSILILLFLHDFESLAACTTVRYVHACTFPGSMQCKKHEALMTCNTSFITLLQKFRTVRINNKIFSFFKNTSLACHSSIRCVSADSIVRL